MISRGCPKPEEYLEIPTLSRLLLGSGTIFTKLNVFWSLLTRYGHKPSIFMLLLWCARAQVLVKSCIKAIYMHYHIHIHSRTI